MPGTACAMQLLFARTKTEGRALAPVTDQERGTTNQSEESARSQLTSNKKSPSIVTTRRASENIPGSDLLSHRPAPAVPSAVEGLTSVFGMGTGVTPPLWPPGNLVGGRHRESVGRATASDRRTKSVASTRARAVGGVSRDAVIDPTATSGAEAYLGAWRAAAIFERALNPPSRYAATADPPKRRGATASTEYPANGSVYSTTPQRGEKDMVKPHG